MCIYSEWPHDGIVSHFLFQMCFIGSGQKKTVYIDSPLLKTEMTVRERSLIYHEESLKLSIKKNGSRNVFHLMTELPANEQQLSPVCRCTNRSLSICRLIPSEQLFIMFLMFLNQESSRRNLVSFENNGLDFEVDLTDLETFGETTAIKIPKMQKEQDAFLKIKTKRSSEHLVNTSSSSQEEINTSLTDMNDAITENTAQPPVSESIVPKTEQMRPDFSQENDKDLAFAGDTDDEKLFIDDSMSPAATPIKQSKTTPCNARPPSTPVSESVPVNSESSSPQKLTRQKRQSKRVKASGDQLSEILRMQTAMFNTANDTSKRSTTSQEIKSPNRCMGLSVHSHPVSLVKPCVTSYLEKKQNEGVETCTAPHESAPEVNITPTEHKS